MDKYKIVLVGEYFIEGENGVDIFDGVSIFGIVILVGKVIFVFVSWVVSWFNLKVGILVSSVVVIFVGLDNED